MSYFRFKLITIAADTAPLIYSTKTSFQVYNNDFNREICTISVTCFDFSTQQGYDFLMITRERNVQELTVQLLSTDMGQMMSVIFRSVTS